MKLNCIFFFHFSLWLLRLSRPMIIYRCTEDVSKAKEAHCTHSFYLTPGLFKKALPKEVYLLLKVSKTWKQIVKPWILPKNKQMNSTLLLWYLRSTCFRSFFGRNWRHQKDISKLTDLYFQVKPCTPCWLNMTSVNFWKILVFAYIPTRFIAIVLHIQ